MEQNGYYFGNKNEVNEILARFNKLFKTEFCYLMDVYHLTASRLILWPKADCFKFLGIDGDVWAANHDVKYLKETGQIRWCSERKIWALDCLFLNYYKKNKPISGDFIHKTVALRVPEREQFVFSCQGCSLFWDITDKINHDDRILCPVCIEKEKAPNKPHTQSGIYQGYHCSVRNGWKYKIQRVGEELSMPMGVELEVDMRGAHALQGHNKIAWAIYKEQQEVNKDWHNLIFERDGSLGAIGMEIISNPMTLEYGSKYWKSMIPIIAKYCTGWEVPEGSDYGIHITVSRKYLSDFNIARIHKFFTAPANSSFMVSIAQRGVIYGGKEIGRISAKLRDNYTFKSKGKIAISAQRYTLINVKDKFVEFRMFHSTLNLESFLKNLEFIDAMRTWAVTGEFRPTYEDFIKWLVSNPTNMVRYNNLLKFLSRKQFHVKKLRHPIINTWKALLNPFIKEQDIPKEETL